MILLIKLVIATFLVLLGFAKLVNTESLSLRHEKLNEVLKVMQKKRELSTSKPERLNIKIREYWIYLQKQTNVLLNIFLSVIFFAFSMALFDNFDFKYWIIFFITALALWGILYNINYILYYSIICPNAGINRRQEPDKPKKEQNDE